MEDYKKVLERYQRELDDVNAKIAVGQSKVEELCSVLGFSSDVTLDFLKGEQEKLQSQISDYDSQLQRLISEFECISKQ